MLEHVHKRIVVKVDTDQRNKYRFDNGIILQMFPDTSQLDRRYTQPTLGIVVSSDELPIASECLLEHNSCHPTNQIFDYKDDNPNIKYFSVPELEVYCWRIELNWDGVDKVADTLYVNGVSDWQPTKYYAIAERVYEPYKGIFHNVKPTQIKNTLLIKTGELKDKIVHIVKNGEYTIIYQDTNGKPNQILVTFHVENEDELSDLILNAKQEIVAVNESLTERYLNGELLTGLTDDDCKPIEIKTLAYAN